MNMNLSQKSARDELHEIVDEPRKAKRDREEVNSGDNIADERSYEDRGKIMQGFRGEFWDRFIRRIIFACITMGSFFSCHVQAQGGKEALWDQYMAHCQRPSDIWEHLPTIRRIAADCSSVCELGVRSMVSTWALLQGLSESPASTRSYLGVDLYLPPEDTYILSQILAYQNDISFDYLIANDLEISLAPVDLLFIDTLHIYAQLTYELETFCDSALKYIVMHDTGEAYEWEDCRSYTGDYSEYPSYIDCSKHGMWRAVLDFLAHHPEWEVAERYHNNCGLTVLRRNS